VRVQKVRDLPQTQLDSEINAAFVLNEHGTAVTSTFYVIISMRTIALITGKKKETSRNLWLLFLANEINATKGDITGSTAHVQVMFPLEDKKNAGSLKTFFLGRR